MLAAHGFETPFSAYISNISVTLVSKIDGRVASLTDATPVMIRSSQNGALTLMEVDNRAKQRADGHRDQWKTRVDVVPNDDGIEKGMIEFFVGTDRLFIRLRPLTSGEAMPLAPPGNELPMELLFHQPPEKLLQNMRWK